MAGLWNTKADILKILFNVVRTTVTFKISALLALRCERFLLIKNEQLWLFQSDVSAAEAGQTNTQMT